MASKKESRELIEELQAQRWRIEDRGSTWVVKHPTMTDPKAYPSVTIHKTPSDHRAWRNALSVLKRQGFIWPPPKKRSKNR